jgi:outer membrane protein
MSRNKLIKIIMVFLVGSVAQAASGASLWDTYQQATKSDPTFQAAFSTELSAAEAVPQYRAALLPQVNLTQNVAWSRSHIKSDNYNTTVTGEEKVDQTFGARSTDFTLSLSQQIFDWTSWLSLVQASDSVKAAKATYNSAAQDLMVRTSSAYFNVLLAQDVLAATKAEKRALEEEYKKAKQSFDVGVSTITDVYNAKAAYDGAISDYVTAQNKLADAKEDLRAITGDVYGYLDPLNDKIPLKNPDPSDIDQWTQTAIGQSWDLKAATYSAQALRAAISAAVGGHLPTVTAVANYGNQFTRNSDSLGYTRTRGPEAEIDLALPLYSGGAVSSSVRKAMADYDTAVQNQEKAHRTVISNARKSYLGVMTGITKVQATQQMIVSDRSSLEGMQEGYKVGTRTMVDVLNAQKTLYNALKEYAAARYGYVNSIIALKQAAGTLNEKDISEINGWLKLNSPSAASVSTQTKPNDMTLNAVEKA